MSEFKFEIEEHLIVLSENEVEKEVDPRFLEWCAAKFDLRQWSPRLYKNG